MKKHSKFSPSSAHRWLNCSGSLLYQDHDAPPSKYAIEGTMAHEICEHLVKGGKSFRVGHSVQVTSGDILYDETLHSAAMIYCEFVWAKEKELGTKAEIERRVDLWDTPVFGTSDAVIWAPFEKLVIIDFKYGKGEIVSPFQNEQLIIYALSFLGSLADPETVELCIVQPRSYEDEKIKIWQTTPEELLTGWPSLIQMAIAEHEQKEHQFNCGEWCQWCFGIGKCPEVQKSIDLALDEATDIEKITKILTAEKLIKDSLKKIKEEAYQYLLEGGRIPGFKLVRSFGDRIWKDPDRVKRKFGQKKSCELKLLTPAQLEKQATKKEKEWIAKHTEKPNRGLILVPESDRREAELPGNSVDAFNIIGEEK